MFSSDQYWFKSNIRKKLPQKKWSGLLLPSGEMPLMMKTNSKILPSQDSNLSCYSPSTLTFSAPAFYLSSFKILTRRISPSGKLPSTNCPKKIAPIKVALGGGGWWVVLGLGLGNSPGAIFWGAIFLVPAKGKPHFKAKFSSSKNRTVTWQNAYSSKRACQFQFVIPLL